MFSSRLPAALAPNAVSRAVAALRESGVALIDVTETNPTAVDLPEDGADLASLADPRSQRYAPDPRGLLSAREAIAAEYARRGARVPPDRLILTASTSEAYALLFKLLCDPGDEVLVPQPSYPLFDLLTSLEAVRPRPYHLDYHGLWSIDRPSLEDAVSSAARAVLVVSPNNPTGSMTRADDRAWLAAACAAHGLAIIADEVFADYPLAPRADACSLLGETRALTFVLGGLSKSAGLPQVKLGWIAVSGPDALASAAIERLEVISDTYLSVSTPVQVAAARLIEGGRSRREAIAARVQGNLAALRAAVRGYPSITLREPEGGWCAVVEVPATRSEEALVLTLLEAARVIAHPGYFFDFSGGAFLVVSLLPRPDLFAEGVRRMLPIAAGGASS
ncbi:MAG TPA: pyridoxal phosphate-dependent aminotransferase [Vicinamibacterales bacterium]|nr:pyridoxal phosphate-dependent aminotransferase [Vicinamibacterales bacterium]